jgi:hypothetical protein
MSSPLGIPSAQSSRADHWFYPKEFENDLAGLDLPDHFKDEVLTCGWEYTRCVIPQWTNWKRYCAFVCIVTILVLAEFKGELVHVDKTDMMLNYNLQDVLDDLFAGTVGHEAMSRECRAFLVIASEKSQNRVGSALLRRYISALASSPQNWFRLRDCDALARFSIAAAWACNDLDDAWLAEDEWQTLAEMGCTQYDADAFYKHRAEGETCNTFAYLGEGMRVECTRRCREIVWALDVAWADKPAHRIAMNFLRPFGAPEDKHVVAQARQNVKLWHRFEDEGDSKPSNHAVGDDETMYSQVLAQSGRLLFDGLGPLLEASGGVRCADCRYRDAYGAEQMHRFGGVSLCDKCQGEWVAYARSITERVANVWPEVTELAGWSFGGKGRDMSVGDNGA